jgi:MoaA/NifB/PqqE/SkfB family radical SAM enzyme
MTGHRDNKHICALPWTHLHVTTTGKVTPCGQATIPMHGDSSLEFGNIQDYELFDVINSPGMMAVRAAMLRDEPNEICRVCEHKMLHDMRSTKDVANDAYLDRVNYAIAATSKDGYLPIDAYKPLFLDVRFGNKCNLRCRMCNLEASSAWYDETVNIHRIHRQGGVPFDHVHAGDQTERYTSTTAYDKIEHLLDHAEKIYFAGGEPLIMPEHYQVLDRLISSGRSRDVELHYSTNFTVSQHRNKPLVEYWKHFNKVVIAGSVDGIEEVSDYIRTGSKWEKIKQIHAELKPAGDTYANITISPCFSVSIMNIFHVPRFYRWLFENGWLGSNVHPITINYVDWPPDLSIKILPKNAKHKVMQIFDPLLVWLRDQGHPDSAANIAEILTYMNSEDLEFDSQGRRLLDSARARLDTYDVSAALDWRRTLPELSRAIDEGAKDDSLHHEIDQKL